MERITSAIVVCNNKVITERIGKMVLSCLVILLSVHYVYNLEYNPKVHEVLEFLQEKLLSDGLPPKRKTSKVYDQLYRAIDCLEGRTSETDKEQEEYDDDETQPFCEY